ncbi:MAG: hypothetical protein V8T00_04560 [Oscillospiraceae bacterium]
MTAIVTDAHYRMSVSLIRDLSDRGVRVVACEKASIKNPVGFASRGVLRCVRLPEDGYLDALLALCREILAQEGEKPALLPVGAKTLALLSEHRERFSPVAGLCIATPTQLALLNDKAAVSSLAQKLSVPVPENFERKSGENLDAFFSRVPLPCAVKPHCGETFGLTAAQRYRICRTKEALQEAFSHFQAITQEDPIVQEYLPGEAFGCSVLAKDGTVYRTICHHRLREYPVSGGPSSCCESISRTDLCAYAGKLCGKPAFPALRCSSSNAVRAARPGSWKLTPASGVRSRSRARPGRILPTAGSVWRQTFPYRKSSPQPLCAWSTIRRTLPRRSVISGQESPGSFSPCCVTL